MNPDQNAFCIGGSKTTATLPIRINQTSPILIELLRFDLDTNSNETITIASKEARKLKKQADRDFGRKDNNTPRELQFAVKKTGLYRLKRVIDESKLDVQRRISDTLVVQCPSASIKPVPSNKCLGQLSDFHLRVDATPPFQIKYSKKLDGQDYGSTTLNIHPENLVSPLARQRTSGALVTTGTEANADVSWARSQHVEIPLNETLGAVGTWQYWIDQVEDACGNTIHYGRQDEVGVYKMSSPTVNEQKFAVHERPRITLSGCDLQNPLKVARGQCKRLPVRSAPTSLEDLADSAYTISYLFTNYDKLGEDGEHTADPTLKLGAVKHNNGPEICDPGLYTLKAVSNSYCSGEVLEPSSCLLENPPQPDLAIHSEKIPDKCAGNTIGLTVDLDFIGTPPFRLVYRITRTGGNVAVKTVSIDTIRTQLELRPSEAGHYIYQFVEISDKIYDPVSLKPKNLLLEQDVKPPASARFADYKPRQNVCLGEAGSFSMYMFGEAPWTLEYELVHGSKREKFIKEHIEDDVFSLETRSLSEGGGEYLLGLTSVIDATGCKVFLEQQAKIEVRHQRPKAAFGELDGKRSALTLENKRIGLPLRLSGEPPWTVTYRNLNDGSKEALTKQLPFTNDRLDAIAEGVYEITDVHDAVCPGSVDASANQFEVQWIPRPSIHIAEGPTVQRRQDRYVKKDVCEADEDALEVSLIGTSPFQLAYDQRLKPERGSQATSRKKLTEGMGVASIRLDTSQPGHYEYTFPELGDHYYDPDRRKFSQLTVEQTVHARPFGRFDEAGRTYSYCQDEEARGEFIPITMTGVAPFHLEFGIKHQANAKPEVITVPSADTNHYRLHIPHRLLALGTHVVTIRKVRDARGCQRKTDFDGPSVLVHVADVPTISPLEATTDYCVGDRISYTLSGTPPFSVFYTFEGIQRKASAPTSIFRRLAEKPGNFTITAISDKTSTETCKAHTKITKMIHELPSVRISKGRVAEVDIHEGDDAEIVFDFGGTPPFEFTYTRSTNAAKGKRSQVLETRHDVSYEHTKSVRASEEGTYEVVSIRDQFCGVSTQGVQGRPGQKVLTF